MGWRVVIVPQRWALVERGILTLRPSTTPHGPLVPVEVPADSILRIGRSPTSDVSLPSLAVNRLHAELRRDPDGVWLRDLDSRSGTHALTHASPTLSEVRQPTRLEVDDTFRLVDFGLVLTPDFAVPPAWRHFDGGAIWRLAQAAQKDRDWSTLPVLADALEEAGCAEPDLLTHFRTVEHRLGHCAALLRLLEGLVGRPRL